MRFKKLQVLMMFALSLLVTSCQEKHDIVNNVDEREANEILVFLASRGIEAKKILVEGGTTPEGAPMIMWNISVDDKKAMEALALLNQNGLPRRKGPNLLSLFAKQGLMTTDREETIRYQSGLEEELKNTIRKIDGVIDADVRISFPPQETTAMPGAPPPKIKAAVYIKHQGVLDDPNSHLESKIKRLLAGSINGLDYDSISIISDRSRLSDVKIKSQGEIIAGKEKEREYVQIWSITMSKDSAMRFRTFFFIFIFLILGIGSFSGWLLYRFYPLMHKKEEEKLPEEEVKE
jgi:type III secretion protein J